MKEKWLALDLSLREFARQVGMQASNYCNVEAAGWPPPPAETLEKLARSSQEARLGQRRVSDDHQ